MEVQTCVRAFGNKTIFVPSDGPGSAMGSTMAMGLAAGLGTDAREVKLVLTSLSLISNYYVTLSYSPPRPSRRTSCNIYVNIQVVDNIICPNFHLQNWRLTTLSIFGAFSEDGNLLQVFLVCKLSKLKLLVHS